VRARVARVTESQEATHHMQHDDSNATLWDTLEAHGVPCDANAPAREAAACAPRNALHPSIAAAVRTAYFCDAGELAVRYGISADDVVGHLERAGLARMPRPERCISNIRCAVHATALVRGEPQAWADRVTALGPVFDRACSSRLDRTRGIQFARRFWGDLRDSSTDAVLAEAASARTRPARRPRGVRPPDLRTFPAVSLLRNWLAERLLGSLEVELGRAASCAQHLDSDDGARTLRIPALRSFGAEAKAT
jgi:hypothetical protein